MVGCAPTGGDPLVKGARDAQRPPLETLGARKTGQSDGDLALVDPLGEDLGQERQEDDISEKGAQKEYKAEIAEEPSQHAYNSEPMADEAQGERKEGAGEEIRRSGGRHQQEERPEGVRGGDRGGARAARRPSRMGDTKPKANTPSALVKALARRVRRECWESGAARFPGGGDSVCGPPGLGAGFGAGWLVAAGVRRPGIRR